MRYSIQVNGKQRAVEADPDLPVLWVLRDLLDLKGTKFGCGKSLCCCGIEKTIFSTISIVPADSISSRQVWTPAVR